jgi:hypothetical protein
MNVLTYHSDRSRSDSDGAVEEPAFCAPSENAALCVKP